MKRLNFCVWALALFSILALSACSSSDGNADGGDEDGFVGADLANMPCEPGQTRCEGMSYHECVDGYFVWTESCADPQICAQDYGCVDCNPAAGKRCWDGDVYACNADGSLGSKTAECADAGCEFGSCVGVNECSAESQLIYVVDNDYRLLSFSPTDGNQFQMITNLESICSPGSSWPAWGIGTATPFSMSVDRDARAWVLFTSGEIMWVDIPSRTCVTSPFSPGTLGFQLFGMGFVSDAAGSEEETLWIAGGGVGSLDDGDLASLDPDTMQVSVVGDLPSPAGSSSPEMTGTGAGVLYAYFPGSTTFVAELNKSNASITEQWNMPALNGQIRAWAFAHWGGKFYIFVTVDDNSQVLKLDPATGQTTTLLENLPYIIVGAGVSTCAPTVEL